MPDASPNDSPAERAGPGAWRLRRSLHVPRPRSEVFAFFADAANLEAITPGFLRFRILTPLPIAMREGALIEYRLRLFGVPFRWGTVIERWAPGEAFVDLQLRGPYRLWRHTHRFRDAPDGGTLMEDEVEYALPFGPLGAIAHALFVRRSVERIFAHRNARIAELLAPPRRGG